MSQPRPHRIAVLGDGGWGTTLAIHAFRQGHSVVLWGAFPAYVRQMIRRRQNTRFLPGIPLPRPIHLTADLDKALDQASLVILAVPSQHLRSVASGLRSPANARIRWLSVAKGLETGTLLRMSEVIRQELGQVKLAVLSGPNIAMEIARGKPASSVIACRDRHLAGWIQQLLMSSRFRLYTTSDVTGVELGGALKNPIAIAAGIADGLGCGSNAKAALITRGVIEMARLGRAMGAREHTFWGLSGLGDLVTTCLSGRNHWFGEAVGKGRVPHQVLGTTPRVIEGFETTRAAVSLARRHQVELPIIEQVHAVLFRHRSPRKALEALMRRQKGVEL